MISILIPTYNYNSAPLVHDLHEQLLRANIAFEILLADDASTLYIDENRAVNDLPNCRFIELEKNIGRARIRNFLADKAQYPYLLFLDGDMRIRKTDFVETYLTYCHGECAVVGGCDYDPKMWKPQYSLRMKYGTEREGNMHYARTFLTANFMISKSLFQQVRFDENIHGYGHEDTIFGLKTKELVEIKHIDNPATHCGLDDNRIYIAKTEESIGNLLLLYQTRHLPELLADSKLLSMYAKTKRWRMTCPIALFFRITKPLAIRLLCKKNPNLLLFDIYKLGFICTL